MAKDWDAVTEHGGFSVGERVRIKRGASFVGMNPRKTYTIRGFFVLDDPEDDRVFAAFAEIDTYWEASSPDMSCDVDGLLKVVAKPARV